MTDWLEAWLCWLCVCACVCFTLHILFLPSPSSVPLFLCYKVLLCFAFLSFVRFLVTCVCTSCLQIVFCEHKSIESYTEIMISSQIKHTHTQIICTKLCVWFMRKRERQIKKRRGTQSVSSAMLCVFAFYYYYHYRLHLLWINFRDAVVLIWKSWCRAWVNFHVVCVGLAVSSLFVYILQLIEQFRVANQLVDLNINIYIHAVWWNYDL